MFILCGTVGRGCDAGSVDGVDVDRTSTLDIDNHKQCSNLENDLDDSHSES